MMSVSVIICTIEDLAKDINSESKNVLNPQNHSLNILNTVQTILLSTQTLCKELEVYLENYFEIVASSAKFIAYVYIYTL